jgi:hypothetical protein
MAVLNIEAGIPGLLRIKQTASAAPCPGQAIRLKMHAHVTGIVTSTGALNRLDGPPQHRLERIWLDVADVLTAATLRR